MGTKGNGTGNRPSMRNCEKSKMTEKDGRKLGDEDARVTCKKHGLWLPVLIRPLSYSGQGTTFMDLFLLL